MLRLAIWSRLFERGEGRRPVTKLLNGMVRLFFVAILLLLEFWLVVEIVKFLGLGEMAQLFLYPIWMLGTSQIPLYKKVSNIRAVMRARRYVCIIIGIFLLVTINWGGLF